VADSRGRFQSVFILFGDPEDEAVRDIYCWSNVVMDLKEIAMMVGSGWIWLRVGTSAAPVNEEMNPGVPQTAGIVPTL
jgi:hypothetical protein